MPLICDERDEALPFRHTLPQRADPRAVPHAFYAGALGYEPSELRRRVVSFYEEARSEKAAVNARAGQ